MFFSLQGFSTSETWYAVLDYGTNYCNLHNLITGEVKGQKSKVFFVKTQNLWKWRIVLPIVDQLSLAEVKRERASVL